MLIVSVAGLLECATTDTASAGCGDYVLVNGKPLMTSRHAQAPPRQHAPEPFQPESLPRPPCDGPHCGRQLPLPIPAEPSVPNATSSDPWCRCLAQEALVADPWRGRLVAESQLSLRDGCPMSIERPPRLRHDGGC